jgi:two-component system, NarL family, nitrate/nitrite response regulator NarL
LPTAIAPGGETVLLADRHAAVRAGTRLVLERAGFRVVEVRDASSALEAVVAHRPDVCLVDVGRVEGGARIVERLSSRTTVVVFTDAADEAEMLAVLRAGAAGYLLKSMDPARLGPTLRGVLRGEAALPRELVSRVIGELRRRPPAVSLPGRQGVDLTPRESEVLTLLREGMSTKQIARQLSMSAVTVRRHVAEIVRKLGVPNRAAALDLLGRRSQQ